MSNDYAASCSPLNLAINKDNANSTDVDFISYVHLMHTREQF